jgi:GBP family porin
LKALIVIGAAIASLPLATLAQTVAAPPSSVTVYGRLDVSANYLRYGGTATASSTNAKYVSSDSSHLGFRGNEDLGGGLRAYFKLEHWFNVDTGAQFNPASFWSREAYVGLGDSNLGSIQLGSQYAPSTWVSLRTDPFVRSNQGAIFTLFQQVPGNLRGFNSTVSNTVQYISPSLSGVTARVMTGLGEGVTPGASWHGSLDYNVDRIYAGVSIDRTKVAGAVVGQPSVARVNNTTLTAGATYRFDVAKLHAYYMHNDLEGLPKVTGYMLGTTVPIGAGEIRASYSRRNINDAAGSDATLISAGYFYYLSKRTTVYAVASRLENKGAAHFNLWPASTDAGAAFARAGETVTGGQLGIRHFF